MVNKTSGFKTKLIGNNTDTRPGEREGGGEGGAGGGVLLNNSRQASASRRCRFVSMFSISQALEPLSKPRFALLLKAHLKTHIQALQKRNCTHWGN